MQHGRYILFQLLYIQAADRVAVDAPFAQAKTQGQRQQVRAALTDLLAVTIQRAVQELLAKYWCGTARVVIYVADKMSTSFSQNLFKILSNSRIFSQFSASNNIQ